VKFSRRSRDTPPCGGAMPPIDFSNNSNKRLTYPGSGFASRSVRTSVRLDAQREPSENKRAGAWYQARAIAETAAKLQGRTTRSERARRWPRRPRNQAEGSRQRAREGGRHGTGRARPARRS
jgi:hypothetical protein